MTAKRISERDWLKGAQAQAEEWYTSGIEAARARVLAAHREHERALDELEDLCKRRERALDELEDLCKRRAEMRESFARMWAGTRRATPGTHPTHDHDVPPEEAGVEDVTPWWAVEPWTTRPWPPHTDPKENTMENRFTPSGLTASWLQLAAITLVRCSAVAASGMLGLAKMISREAD